MQEHVGTFLNQDSVSDVMELLKRQEDLEAMIQAQGERFVALQKKKTQVSSSFKHQD